jgi:hypothetical protein
MRLASTPQQKPHPVAHQLQTKPAIKAKLSVLSVVDALNLKDQGQMGLIINRKLRSPLAHLSCAEVDANSFLTTIAKFELPDIGKTNL